MVQLLETVYVISTQYLETISVFHRLRNQKQLKIAMINGMRKFITLSEVLNLSSQYIGYVPLCLLISEFTAKHRDLFVNCAIILRFFITLFYINFFLLPRSSHFFDN